MHHVFAAKDLAEFVQILKQQQGDSNDSLAAKIGVGGTTIHRILKGYNVDDDTLDKIATYANIPREYVYALAKGIQPSEQKYSQIVTMIANLLEQAPPEIQELFFVQARAVIENRNKDSAKTS